MEDHRPRRQAHGSQPEKSIDPIVAAAAMVLRLQTIVSRELAPSTPAVVTVGTFHAGLKENIIPEFAEFSVNVRTPMKTPAPSSWPQSGGSFPPKLPPRGHRSPQS